MKIEDLKTHIDGRFDKVETKLDEFGERIAVTETHVSWLRGHLNITTAILGTVVSGVIVWWLTNN